MRWWWRREKGVKRTSSCVKCHWMFGWNIFSRKMMSRENLPQYFVDTQTRCTYFVSQETALLPLLPFLPLLLVMYLSASSCSLSVLWCIHQRRDSPGSLSLFLLHASFQTFSYKNSLDWEAIERLLLKAREDGRNQSKLLNYKVSNKEFRVVTWICLLLRGYWITDISGNWTNNGTDSSQGSLNRYKLHTYFFKFFNISVEAPHPDKWKSGRKVMIVLKNTNYFVRSRERVDEVVDEVEDEVE